MNTTLISKGGCLLAVTLLLIALSFLRASAPKGVPPAEHEEVTIDMGKQEM